MQNMEEFEKRIRFEEGIKKGHDHLVEDFNNHLRDEVKYMEKFEKVQESHNNILNRVNNVEDDIDDISENMKDYFKNMKDVNDKVNSLDKCLLILKFIIGAIAFISLIALSAHPSIFKLIEPIMKLF